MGSSKTNLLKKVIKNTMLWDRVPGFCCDFMSLTLSNDASTTLLPDKLRTSVFYFMKSFGFRCTSMQR